MPTKKFSAEDVVGWVCALVLVGFVLGVVAGASHACSALVRTAGPMNFPSPFPVTLLLLGWGLVKVAMRCLPEHRGRLGVAAAVAVLLPGLWNFYFWPPIDDGAYFLLRYGDQNPAEMGCMPAGAEDFAMLMWVAFLLGSTGVRVPPRFDSRLVRWVGFPAVAGLVAYGLVVGGREVLMALLLSDG